MMLAESFPGSNNSNFVVLDPNPNLHIFTLLSDFAISSNFSKHFFEGSKQYILSNYIYPS